VARSTRSTVGVGGPDDAAAGKRRSPTSSRRPAFSLLRALLDLAEGVHEIDSGSGILSREQRVVFLVSTLLVWGVLLALVALAGRGSPRPACWIAHPPMPECLNIDL
jgi:hypothetical protein